MIDPTSRITYGNLRIALIKAVSAAGCGCRVIAEGGGRRRPTIFEDTDQRAAGGVRCHYSSSENARLTPCVAVVHAADDGGCAGR